MKTISILGADYSVEVRKFLEDSHFIRDGIGGYCNSIEKQIVICDMNTHPSSEEDSHKRNLVCMKEIARHELVHAFLWESGLASNSMESDAWANNEEMVDWIAIQLPKLATAAKDIENIVTSLMKDKKKMKKERE